MADLLSMMKNLVLNEALKYEDKVKPILVLLVDSSPNENFRHLKYCKLFLKLNLDYFTIQTYALRQSAYNPVEHSMSTLSGKLAGIVLPIDHFGSHLDSSDNVINNYIYGKEVLVEYVNQEANIFSEVSTKEAYALLDENNGFLLSATKCRDGHFLNPIHILQYMEQTKLPGYNQH
ncbi:20688_t:CDS:2, partial [Cetraspora pellucida]